eukprot:c21560_g1_i2 orf=371-1636(-)
MKDNDNPVEERYTQWKSLVPVLYDWLANHNLVWPSLSCRWGPQLEQATYKNRQRLYLSEQTDGSVPNTLVIANCEVVKPRVAAAEHISQFNEEARSPFVKKYKTIIHPGEVNRIRELPQNRRIVATHTDGPEVYIWNVETQPNCQVIMGATFSCPDLTLTGHTENAEFALALSPAGPLVLSGGKDKCVILWNIQDHITSAKDSPAAKSGTSAAGKQKSYGSGSANSILTDSPHVAPQGIFKGHTDTVEDVQFHPSSTHEFCSVGDDSRLILWDARIGHEPAQKVENAHNADVHCVDWSQHEENVLLTGSADNSARMFDRRKLTASGRGTPLHIFEGHTAPVLCVQWCPERKSVFGSSAEDGFLNLWDYEKVTKKREETKSTSRRSTSPPAGLFFPTCRAQGQSCGFPVECTRSMDSSQCVC